jgi:phospholipid/cholesterol/gamma-HCH transport system permease protein
MASWHIARSDECLEIAGVLRIVDAAAIWRALRDRAVDPGKRLDFDLHGAELVDGAVLSLLIDLRRELVAAGTTCELVNVPRRLLPLVHVYRGDQPPEVPVPRVRRQRSPIRWLGSQVLRVLYTARSAFVFTARVVGAIVGDVRRIHWRAVPALLERAGTDGIPVVVVANFLVGFTMAYQSMEQLKMYGANIYVADIVGVSVSRELAPLMTGILVIGRSGAAYAAELGAMRVSEEIDALRTMGFSPISYLVAPRVVALAIAAPVLSLLGTIAGVFGGLVVGTASLGVTSHAYLAELRSTLVLSDVWTGLVKSVAFGIAIAFIGCREGLSTRGAATGVGRSTTATVVASTFAIIVIDTVFTVFFREFGL